MNKLYLLEADNQFDTLKIFVEENANELEAYDMEKAIFSKLLKIGLSLLSHSFAKVEEKNEKEKIITEDNEIYNYHGQSKCNYFSIFGELSVNRTRNYKKDSGSIFVLDNQCNLPELKYSHYLQEIMTKLNISNSFEDASQKLLDFFGIKISSSSFEKVNNTISIHYDEFYEQKPIPDNKSEGELQISSFDGKGVPMIKKEAAKIKGRQGKGEKRQKKKEAMVGVSYTVDKKIRSSIDVANNLIYPERKKLDKEKQEKAKNIRRTASILKPKSEVIKEIESESIKRNKSGKKNIVLIDGSLYLWSMVITGFTKIKDYVVILDIIHVLEYIYLAANALFTTGSPENLAYAHKMLLRILRGDVKNVIGYLKCSKKRKGLSKSKQDAIQKVITYFTNHTEIMKYNIYLPMGYPIGTGVVESTCKLLVNDRMEGSGMRWSIKGAESMLQMRSLEKSKDTKEYFDFFRKQEKKRLYKTKYQKLKKVA